MGWAKSGKWVGIADDWDYRKIIAAQVKPEFSHKQGDPACLRQAPIKIGLDGVDGGCFNCQRIGGSDHPHRELACGDVDGYTGIY